MKNRLPYFRETLVAPVLSFVGLVSQAKYTDVE
jgi:hypothetical protein